MGAQEDFQDLQSMAERLGLEEEESDNFISSAMKRLGHRARQMWEDGDDNDRGNGGGDFFSGKRRERRSTQPDRRRGGSGRGWQYRDAG